MTRVTIEEAKRRLEELIVAARSGDQVVVAEDGSELVFIVSAARRRRLPDLSEFRARFKEQAPHLSDIVIENRAMERA